MECGNDKPGFVPSRLERNLTELLANYNCTQHPDLAGHHFSLTHINSGLDYSSRLLAGLSARMSFPTPVHFIPCCQINHPESHLSSFPSFTRIPRASIWASHKVPLCLRFTVPPFLTRPLYFGQAGSPLCSLASFSLFM